MMLTISPLMTLIALVSLPGSMAITAFIAKKLAEIFLEQQRAIGELNGHVEEMYAGHKIVKAFGQGAGCPAKFTDINRRLYQVGWKAQFISGIIHPALNFVNNLSYVAVCVVGGLLVAKRAIEIGDIQAFIQYMRQFTQPIVQLANIANILQSTVASAERIFEILDEPEQIPDREDAPALPYPKGRVEFKQVNFGYNAEMPLMQNLNLTVEPGQTIAIVGPTGAGKTTLVNLLLRFYEVQGGRILIDRVNIADLKRGDLRSLFGMVLQDTWLFNGSIGIILPTAGRTKEDEIIKAAKAAHAHHFIKTLPEGYDTILNEEASNISQGQKQLLTIAGLSWPIPPSWFWMRPPATSIPGPSS